MELAEYLVAGQDLVPAEIDRYRIGGDKEALWALRKLKAAQAKIADNIEAANEERRLIDSWLEEVNGSLERDANFFEGLLRDYALRCRDDENDGRKSIKLPGGTIRTRAGSTSVSIGDADAFLSWAEVNNPDLIRVKKEPNLSEIKETVTVTDEGSIITADGEVVPGLVVKTTDVSATVETLK